MKKYYLRLEGVNLANFVYDTQDLSTIRGGGLLLLDSIDMVQEKVKSVNLNAISTGASVGLFEFDSDEKNAGNNVKKDVVNYLNQHPQLKHATFVVDVQPSSGDFIEDKEILVAMNRCQQMQSLSVAVPSQLSDADKVACWIDGVRPAKVSFPDSDTKKTRYKSISVDVRKTYGTKKKKTLYEKIYKEIKRTELGFEFVNDLDELTNDPKKDNLRHKMAVIYLDGNGFGKIRDKLCKTVDDEREFDKQVKSLRKQMLSDFMDKMKHDKNWKTDEGKYRIETLLWGGDELIWIVPAWKGWEALMFFYQHSKNWKYTNTKKEEAPLTHAGGMVCCHHNAPIYRIKDLVKKLSDSAKEKDKSENLFAYQVLESFDHISHNFDDIRNRLAADGNSVSLILNGKDMEDIQKNINYLKENEFPKNKLHKIVKELRSGKDVNDVIEKTIKDLPGEFENNLLKLKETCNGNNSKWVHIADLWDYIVQD